MPTFQNDAEIDVDEFIEACSPREIKRLIKILVEYGHINEENLDLSKISINEMEFRENLSYLSEKFHILTLEEEELIRKISKRFRY